MEDPVEIRRRIEALAKRVNRRGDYGTLLAAGELAVDISEVDPPKWRARIKSQARADKIKIRTGQTERIVWAMLQQPFDKDERLCEVRVYMNLMQGIEMAAKEHGHSPFLVVRDQNEALVGCKNCQALGYLDTSGAGMTGGNLVDENCAGS